MTERPALSKGEMEVARVLWQLGRGTVRQVHEAFPPERKIDFATVQTYLRRLENKGYISSHLSGRACVYAVKVRPRKVIGQAIDELIDRLFDGEALPLMRHLIEDRGISEHDLAELRKLIGKLEARND
jgi:BlaI family transcriptional regulator, penicillinase repressor